MACIDEKIVGDLSLQVEASPRRSHVATFGISVAADAQGRGVGSALMREMINLCDNWMRIERIELTVFSDNPAALALYLPAMNLPQGTAVAGQAESEVKLPAGIVLASAQTSWSAVFASGY